MNNYRWLTELSQHFLDRDYLVNGQTTDERVTEICVAAERYLNKPGFAEKFKSYFQKGWYSFSTPVWTNFGNDRGLPISCVSGETWINTKENGGRFAKDIQVGDEVLTHKGRYRKVLAVIPTCNRGDLYRLKIACRMTDLVITGDHRVLTNLGWVRVDELDPMQHLVAVNRQIDLPSRSHEFDLTKFCDYDYSVKEGRIYKKGAMTVRADRQVETVSYYAAPTASLPLNEELGWLLGVWFAEGSITRNGSGNPNGARITVNSKDEKSLAKKWLDIATRLFQINGAVSRGVAVREGKHNEWLNVNVNSLVVGKFFAQFGDDCKTKTIPQCIIESPNPVLEKFLDGFMSGDGSIRKNGRVKVTLANPKLILQVYQICLKLGLTMSLQMRDKAGKLATTPHVYTIIIRPDAVSKSRFRLDAVIPFSDGLSYSPIRLIEKLSHKETVYDFTVEEDHSFSAAGVVLHNCFGSYIDDNMESIAGTWAEVCMMTKHGGGTSAYFGQLRRRGAKIRKNGESSGSVHFAQPFDMLINVISQGKTRRGNFAGYWPIDHPDIVEALMIRTEGFPIQDLSYGVCVPDYWMEEMIGDGTPEGGDKFKRVVWAKVLEARANVGFPYIMFTDNVNRNTVDCYKDKGLRIWHSNLCCVVGNERVPSNRGLLTVRELYEHGGELELFDGDEVVKTSEMKLISSSEEVFRITLKNGMTHTVTKCHKIQTDKGMVKVADLRLGDRVAIQTKKGLFGSRSMQDEAFLLGLYQTDGTQYKDQIMLDVWESDFDLIPEIEERFARVFHKYGCNRYTVKNQCGVVGEKSLNTPRFRDCVVRQSKVRKMRLTSNCLKKSLGFEKGYIPSWLWESDEDSQWQYVRALFYADGSASIQENTAGKPLYLSIANINKDFLREVQILLANLGIKTSLGLMRCAGKKLLPDGCGSHKLYDTKDIYRLVSGSKNTAIAFEERTNFLSRKKVFFDKTVYRDNSRKVSEVVSIEYAGKEPVYCCEVYNDKHRWICNGVQTKNSEIMLPDGPDESFVCDLSSMNDLYFDEWRNTDAVELMVYLLDAVMTEFILKASKIEFMHRTVRFAERHRALGIGQIGWHSYLQSKMIPFESMEAKLLNVQIAKTIKEQAYAASAKAALEYGEPDVCKGYGRRNTTLIAIAPTKSSAFIIGQSSEAIEPERTNYFIKDLQKGKYTVKNKFLEDLLREKGHDTPAIWDSILKHGGSVQHLDILDDHEKLVFKTFQEISQREVVIQAAARQKYIDQSQSLNLMIHPSVPTKDVNALMIEGWRLGVKSYYYQYSVNAAQAFSRSILQCTSCE